MSAGIHLHDLKFKKRIINFSYSTSFHTLSETLVLVPVFLKHTFLKTKSALIGLLAQSVVIGQLLRVCVSFMSSYKYFYIYGNYGIGIIFYFIFFLNTAKITM